jgi:hypothetical protein
LALDWSAAYATGGTIKTILKRMESPTTGVAMNTPRLIMLLPLLFFLYLATAQAAALTKAQVLKELEETFGQAGNGDAARTDLGTFASSQSDMDKAMAILRRHGFETVETWTLVTQQVVNAYIAVKMADQQPDIEAEMARARAEIEASNMSPEQKQQMLAMMEQSMASVRSMADASDEDVATVKRVLPELDAYFEK